MDLAAGAGPGRTGRGGGGPGDVGGAAEGPEWVRACECVCVSVCRSRSTLMHTPTRLHSGSAPSAEGTSAEPALSSQSIQPRHHASLEKVFPVSQVQVRGRLQGA